MSEKSVLEIGIYVVVVVFLLTVIALIDMIDHKDGIQNSQQTNYTINNPQS
jgi:hypothetical protein